VALAIVALLTIVPPFRFPAAVVNLKTTFVLVPPPLSTAVWDREGDTVYDTPLKFELSLTSTVAVAPLGTEGSVATDTVRLEEEFCAPIVLAENAAPPIRTVLAESADWKEKTLAGSGVTIAAGREIIAVSRATNASLI